MPAEIKISKYTYVSVDMQPNGHLLSTSLKKHFQIIWVIKFLYFHLNCIDLRVQIDNNSYTDSDSCNGLMLNKWQTITWINDDQDHWCHNVTSIHKVRLYITMVSCQKGPTRHAYAWQIGPFRQDTLDNTVMVLCSFAVFCLLISSVHSELVFPSNLLHLLALE